MKKGKKNKKLMPGSKGMKIGKGKFVGTTNP